MNYRRNLGLMLRLSTALIAGLFMGSIEIANSQPVQISSNKPADLLSAEFIGNQIDPIVTGKTIKANHLHEWQERRKRYLQCGGLCGKPQPMPEG